MGLETEGAHLKELLGDTQMSDKNAQGLFWARATNTYKGAPYCHFPPQSTARIIGRVVMTSFWCMAKESQLPPFLTSAANSQPATTNQMNTSEAMDKWLISLATLLLYLQVNYGFYNLVISLS